MQQYCVFIVRHLDYNTNNIFYCFCWAFLDYCELLYALGTVKRNASYSQKDTENSTAKWLAGARDRDGKRKERSSHPKQPARTVNSNSQ